MSFPGLRRPPAFLESRRRFEGGCGTLRRRIQGYGDSKVAGVRVGNERKAIVRTTCATNITRNPTKTIISTAPIR